MLIEVFGKWINPAHVIEVDEADHSTYIYLSGMSVTPEGDIYYNRTNIPNRTPTEVASEINKQISFYNYQPKS